MFTDSDIKDNIINSDNSNISALREQYPDGLHFVAGDLHGEWKTLEALLDNICFDPAKDHIYFVGDYNSGGNVSNLLTFMSNYYSEDCHKPGFHMIRGNHERPELCPFYPLDNIPDIIVYRGKYMNYFIAHAGMIFPVFNAINNDISIHPEKDVFVYRIDDRNVIRDAPFRQIIWSLYGLYSQHSHWHNWPSEQNLMDNHACIIHGHTPYPFFFGHDHFSYGDKNLFWSNQHIFFSEDLQSFDVDSNIKGIYRNGESYRGLACICLEVLEETAVKDNRHLTLDGIRSSQNAVFYAEYNPYRGATAEGDINRILNASPEMRTIAWDEKESRAYIV